MSKLFVNLIFSLFLLICFTNCNDDFLDIPETENPTPEVPVNNPTNSFESYLLGEMTKQNILALSALVFQEDEIKYQATLGQSNVEENIPLADNHLFLLASISKTITATALLQLYDQGKFDLDDSVNDYLPFAVNVPNYENTPITFRMLLTHTSGISDGDALDDQYYYEEDSPVTLRFFLENYFVPNGEFYNANQNFHDFEPGTQHEYTNEGNAVIGLLVEIIAEQDFNEYCKQHIFAPLNMTNSFWRLSEINQPIVELYERNGNKNDRVAPYTFTDYPNGGLRSNAEDLFKFNQMLMNGGQWENSQILKSSTVTELFKSQIPDLDNQMGLHFFLMNAQKNLWGHDGGEQGTTTIMAFNPATKVGAIILTNQSDVELDEALIKAYEEGLK